MDDLITPGGLIALVVSFIVLILSIPTVRLLRERIDALEKGRTTDAEKRKVLTDQNMEQQGQIDSLTQRVQLAEDLATNKTRIDELVALSVPAIADGHAAHEKMFLALAAHEQRAAEADRAMIEGLNRMATTLEKVAKYFSSIRE